MKVLNVIFQWLSGHRHHLGIPHMSNGKLVMTCYTCGKEKECQVDLSGEGYCPRS